jgi:hypothetical protein
MPGLKNNFVALTPISSSEINNNFTVISTWDIKNDDLSAQADGANLIFTTTYTYVSGSLEVFVDGLLQRLGNTYDWEESGAQTFTFTAGNAPSALQDVICHYRRSDI